MKWILVIVILSSADDSRIKQIEFRTEAACMSAARHFVAQNPGVELREPRNERNVEQPVLRSYVQCTPQSGDDEK